MITVSCDLPTPTMPVGAWLIWDRTQLSER